MNKPVKRDTDIARADASADSGTSELVCPRCRRVCFSTAELVAHKCHDVAADISAEIALVNERRRGDAELKKMARDTLEHIEGLNNIHDDDVRAAIFEVILTAIRSARDAGAAGSQEALKEVKDVIEGAGLVEEFPVWVIDLIDEALAKPCESTLRTCDMCGARKAPPGRDRGGLSHGLCDDCQWRVDHPTPSERVEPYCGPRGDDYD